MSKKQPDDLVTEPLPLNPFVFDALTCLNVREILYFGCAYKAWADAVYVNTYLHQIL